jgi:uncharacterized protein GlcG (DUF336 family)
MSGLSQQTVQKMLAMAMQIAQTEYKKPMCACVCDSYGFLLGFARMDGAPVRSIAISQSKAYTAVRMGVHTHEFYARVQRDNVQVSYFADPQLTALPGGYVVRSASGEILGGIGVSALAPSEDQHITELVAEAVKKGEI